MKVVNVLERLLSSVIGLCNVPDVRGAPVQTDDAIKGHFVARASGSCFWKTHSQHHGGSRLMDAGFIVATSLRNPHGRHCSVLTIHERILANLQHPTNVEDLLLK